MSYVNENAEIGQDETPGVNMLIVAPNEKPEKHKAWQVVTGGRCKLNISGLKSKAEPYNVILAKDNNLSREDRIRKRKEGESYNHYTNYESEYGAQLREEENKQQ